jgi:septal ring factor EnvC (AmiA/AmiB activator)
MNAAHTPTPRTDTAWQWAHNTHPWDEVVSATLSRQLERELAEVRSKYRDHYEEAERLTREITDSRRSVKYSQDLIITLRCEKDEAMRQRDTLADALRALKELGPPSKAKDIITKALATLEGRGSNPAQKSPPTTP